MTQELFWNCILVFVLLVLLTVSIIYSLHWTNTHASTISSHDNIVTNVKNITSEHTESKYIALEHNESKYIAPEHIVSEHIVSECNDVNTSNQLSDDIPTDCTSCTNLECKKRDTKRSTLLKERRKEHKKHQRHKLRKNPFAKT